MSTITKTPLKSGKLVGSKHVDSLLSTYKKERWVHNTNRLGKEDSLSTWFSWNELNEFIQLARQNGADGIRAYFGVYPQDYEKVPAYRGRQTIVLVATKVKSNENGQLVTKHVYHQTEKGMELLAFNQNNMCPPFCSPDQTLPGDGGYGYIIQDQGLGLTFLGNEEGDTVVL